MVILMMIIIINIIIIVVGVNLMLHVPGKNLVYMKQFYVNISLYMYRRMTRVYLVKKYGQLFYVKTCLHQSLCYRSF